MKRYINIKNHVRFIEPVERRSQSPRIITEYHKQALLRWDTRKLTFNEHRLTYILIFNCRNNGDVTQESFSVRLTKVRSISKNVSYIWKIWGPCLKVILFTAATAMELVRNEDVFKNIFENPGRDTIQSNMLENDEKKFNCDVVPEMAPEILDLSVCVVSNTSQGGK